MEITKDSKKPGKGMKKQIVYYITAKLYFDMDQDIEISSILEELRAIGEATIEDVKIEEVKE